VNIKTLKNGGGIIIKVNILLKGSQGECLKPFFFIKGGGIKGGGFTLELK
jgi:hypothetical protein